MPADAKALVARYERLLTRRSNFDTLWDECAEFIVPHRGQIAEAGHQDATNMIAPGQQQTDRLFDATAPQANVLLAATIGGALTSSAIEWFRLKTRDASLNAVKRVQDWLEDSEGRMYLALRQSNFYQEAMEMYLDLGAFGTGCLFVGERLSSAADFSGFLFRAHSIGAYVVDEGPDGVVDTVMRCEAYTARAALALFPETSTERIRDLAANKPEEPVKILHAVVPRKDLHERGQAAGRQDRTVMDWASVWIELDEKAILEEGGFEEFAYVAPRWSKTSGEMYGRGPGMIALPDIRTLNRAVELVLQAAPLAIQPPRTVLDDGVVGEVDLRPNGLTVVEQVDALQTLKSEARFDVSQVLTEDLRTRVRHVFFWEQLQIQAERVMTATEVERRWETMRRILGPTLGRLESEFLNPLINRCFGIMLRRGAFSEPPEELADADIDIEYEGPLARSQRATRISAFEQVTALLAPFIESKPEILDNFNWDALVRDLAETAGIPSLWLSDEQERARVRGQRQQMMQAQQTMGLVEQGAGAAGKAAPMLKMLQEAGMAQNGQMAA